MAVQAEVQFLIDLESSINTISTKYYGILADTDINRKKASIATITESNCRRGQLRNPGWDTFPKEAEVIVNDFFHQMKVDLTEAVNSRLIKPSAAAELFSWTVAETVTSGLKFGVKSADVKAGRKVNNFRRKIPQKLPKKDQEDLDNIRQLLNWLYRKKAQLSLVRNSINRKLNTALTSGNFQKNYLKNKCQKLTN
jgi:hypothetical protein